jgi:hypothetical protein
MKIEGSLGYVSQLTDSIYIGANYAIIRSLLRLANKFEIKLLRVRRGGREREGRCGRVERLTGNKLGETLLEFNNS